MNRCRRGAVLPAAGVVAIGLLLILALGGWRGLAVFVTAIVIVAVSMRLEDRRRYRR